MIIKWLLSGLLSVIQFYLAHFAAYDTISANNWLLNVMQSVDFFVQYIVNNVASIFFFFVPQIAFYHAIDILFALWTFDFWTSLIMFILRKIPFLSIE